MSILKAMKETVENLKKITEKLLQFNETRKQAITMAKETGKPIIFWEHEYKRCLSFIPDSSCRGCLKQLIAMPNGTVKRFIRHTW